MYPINVSTIFELPFVTISLVLVRFTLELCEDYLLENSEFIDFQRRLA